jgi:hypothetical protein
MTASGPEWANTTISKPKAPNAIQRWNDLSSEGVHLACTRDQSIRLIGVTAVHDHCAASKTRSRGRVRSARFIGISEPDGRHARTGLGRH